MSCSKDDPHSCSHLFAASDLAIIYKEYRPIYPASLYAAIVKYLEKKLSPPFCLAVDVGCGSGQSTFPLSLYFDRVIGIDISAAQVHEAHNHPEKPLNVELRVGNAFDIPLGDSSVSLVCSGTAAHWFDPIEDFYREADRVLVPGGCLAIFAFGIPRIESGKHSNEINEAISMFVEHRGIIEFRPKKSYDVSDHYSNYILPYEDQIRVDSLKSVYNWTVNQLIGYFSSWSFYQQLIKSKYDGEDPLHLLKTRIRNIICASEEARLPVMFTVFALMGRKPCNDGNKA